MNLFELLGDLKALFEGKFPRKEKPLKDNRFSPFSF